MRHLYVSMGEQLGDRSWIIHNHHKPMVGWTRGGCLLMALGGALAAKDRRYRVAARPKSDSVMLEGKAT